MLEIIDNELRLIIAKQNIAIERRIRFVVKPAPRFIPEKTWFKLASKFLVMQETTNFGVDFGAS